MSVPHDHRLANRFLHDLVRLAPAGSYLGTAPKVLRRPSKPNGRPTAIGSPCWSQTPIAAMERLARRVASTQDDFGYLSSFGADWTSKAAWRIGEQYVPLETMVRLTAMREPPVRAGKISELRADGAVLGLMADMDLARPGGENYPPDLEDALDVLNDLSPTLIEQCGRSLPTVWLFDRACYDIDTADELGRDLVAEIGDRCAAHGWTFDSPNSLTAWVRVPGTWSVLRQCLVTVVGGTGARISMDELHELVPVHVQRRSYSGPYMAPDDPWNVGLPGKEIE
jgi:hypothetical protein